jgi:argininosuccinate lyase
MSLWKGRFARGLDPEALAFSSSLPVDRRLFEEDIDGSLAHAAMLARQSIITAGDARKIKRGLEEIRREIRREIGHGRLKNRLPVLPKGGRTGRFVAEDIHMAIEARLIEKIGKAGERLHTARSRNDQIALDERLYLRKTGRAVAGMIRLLQRALLAQARRHRAVIMPGYTHLQRAQPVLLAHHLLAYCAMLDRDYGRVADCLRRSSRSPLGAGALAGTSFPIDRGFVAARLGLSGIVENSIDAVSDRDALVEFTGACAVTMMHLSRLGEELVLWSSREWGFVEMGDAFTTGSSIMPQKKNPDLAELVRGKTGRVYGDLVALLTLLKGLPLAYNRDLQEDKEPLFDAADTTLASLRIMALMVGSLTFRRDRFVQELESDFSAATDLADYLVRKGLPFRAAHAAVGGLVRRCVEEGKSFADLTLRDLRRCSPLFASDALALMHPRSGIALKRSAGSTGPREVARALRAWERRLSRTPARR